jgi:hypothetical protein
MTVSTTELLELLSYATQLGLSYDVKEDMDGDYEIRFYELYTNDFDETIFITKECKSNWYSSSCSFDYLMDTFVSMLKQKEEEKLKNKNDKNFLLN